MLRPAMDCSRQGYTSIISKVRKLAFLSGEFPAAAADGGAAGSRSNILAGFLPLQGRLRIVRSQPLSNHFRYWLEMGDLICDWQLLLSLVRPWDTAFSCLVGVNSSPFNEEMARTDY